MNSSGEKRMEAAREASLASPICSEIAQLRRALKETTDALVHAFCWGDGPVTLEEVEGGRWDGVRALVESNGELLSKGTAWLYETFLERGGHSRGGTNTKTKENQ